MSSPITAPLASAMGIVTTSVPIVAGLVVIDAISGLAKCRKCGFSSKNRKKVEQHAKRHTVRKTKQRKQENIGRDMYKELLG